MRCNGRIVCRRLVLAADRLQSDSDTAWDSVYRCTAAMIIPSSSVRRGLFAAALVLDHRLETINVAQYRFLSNNTRRVILPVIRT
jgi:hypothetical protein